MKGRRKQIVLSWLLIAIIRQVVTKLIGTVNQQTYKDALSISLKGIVSDSNNIFLWHESEDIKKKGGVISTISADSNFTFTSYACIAPYCVKATVSFRWDWSGLPCLVQLSLVTCWSTVMFGTLKDDSLWINILASNNCFPKWGQHFVKNC